VSRLTLSNCWLNVVGDGARLSDGIKVTNGPVAHGVTVQGNGASLSGLALTDGILKVSGDNATLSGLQINASSPISPSIADVQMQGDNTSVSGLTITNGSLAISGNNNQVSSVTIRATGQYVSGAAVGLSVGGNSNMVSNLTVSAPPQGAQA